MELSNDHWKFGLMLFAFGVYVGYVVAHDKDPHPRYDDKTKVWRFDEFQCTQPGCAGHVIGYQWAKDHIGDKCQRTSKSFYEGCQLFLEGYEEYMKESQDWSPADTVN